MLQTKGALDQFKFQQRRIMGNIKSGIIQHKIFNFVLCKKKTLRSVNKYIEIDQSCKAHDIADINSGAADKYLHMLNYYKKVFFIKLYLKVLI